MRGVEAGSGLVERIDHNHRGPNRARALECALQRVGEQDRAQPLTLVIAGVLIKRRGRVLRNPGQLRARPRLSLRPYDTKCPIKCKLLQL